MVLLDRREARKASRSLRNWVQIAQADMIFDVWGVMGPVFLDIFPEFRYNGFRLRELASKEESI